MKTLRNTQILIYFTLDQWIHDPKHVLAMYYPKARQQIQFELKLLLYYSPLLNYKGIIY